MSLIFRVWEARDLPALLEMASLQLRMQNLPVKKCVAITMLAAGLIRRAELVSEFIKSHFFSGIRFTENNLKI